MGVRPWTPRPKAPPCLEAALLGIAVGGDGPGAVLSDCPSRGRTPL